MRLEICVTCTDRAVTLYLRLRATSSPPFFLRDSRASETRGRVKITPREKRRHAACRLFSRGVIFTRARVSLALLSPRKNGGLLVVYFILPQGEEHKAIG